MNIHKLLQVAYTVSMIKVLVLTDVILDKSRLWDFEESFSRDGVGDFSSSPVKKST